MGSPRAYSTDPTQAPKKAVFRVFHAFFEPLDTLDTLNQQVNHSKTAYFNGEILVLKGC
jgi:hypothetical protein